MEDFRQKWKNDIATSSRNDPNDVKDNPKEEFASVEDKVMSLQFDDFFFRLSNLYMLLFSG